MAHAGQACQAVLVAIELPSEVAQLLNFVGIPWINLNEDKVREFAVHVRKFATDISGVHQDAQSTLQELGNGYSGAAYEALVRMWGSKSAHMNDLVEGCGILAPALEAGAALIESVKVACIAELAVMAAEFIADQAASVATLGIAEAALPVIEEATTKLMDFAVQQIEQFIIGEIMNAALQPLLDRLNRMVQGLLIQPGIGTGDPGTGFEVHHEHLAVHAQRMGAHAETARGHVSAFTSNLGALDFAS
jgi:uncharacterized protein YukE/DNA-binding transcriptional regulator YdaS (Cro superfamily)